MKVLTFRSVVAAVAVTVLTVSTTIAQTPVVNQAPSVSSPVPAAPTMTSNVAAPGVGQSYFDSGNACDTGAACFDDDQGIFGFGLLKRSDHAFNDFISPMTNPVFFEDPRALTEARTIFLTHKVPSALGGGSVRLFAVQLRARISENVSIIATKDGYITSDTVLADEGWADLAGGLKFNLIRDTCKGRMLSAGATYEAATGEADVLQGNGQGEVNLFMSGGVRLGQRGHWVSAGGFRLPVNPTDESTSSYWSNHFDYMLAPRFYFLNEYNWYHWLGAGQDGPGGIEGLDIINLGSPGVSGNDIVTSAIGFKFKPGRHMETGFAFEFPLTERRDIIDNRITVDLILRY
jgi:hypothetical protein